MRKKSRASGFSAFAPMYWRMNGVSAGEDAGSAELAVSLGGVGMGSGTGNASIPRTACRRVVPERLVGSCVPLSALDAFAVWLRVVLVGGVGAVLLDELVIDAEEQEGRSPLAYEEGFMVLTHRFECQ